MAAKPKAAFKLETEWVRAYARTYLPSEAAFSFSADALRRAGVTLVDVRNACRKGRVVYADKLEGPGAAWIVEGEDCDGHILCIELMVITAELRVSLHDVYRVSNQEDSNDAA